MRAAFNWGIQNKYIQTNPTKGLKFFPIEKKNKYVPSSNVIDKVIAEADSDTQDYLWTIRETMARINEINQLQWKDVNFEGKYIVLYTRKNINGDLTPRNVSMTTKLYEVLQHRFESRDKNKPWVFWHRYWSKKKGCFCEGPYKDRKRLMKSLCKKAGVKYFKYHAFRHSGASIMDRNRASYGSIQRLLGHKNRRTTETYLHSIGGVEREAIAIFEHSRQKSHTDSHTDDN